MFYGGVRRKVQRALNEVSTCLLKYLNKLASKGVKLVHLICDRCTGQNCNRMVFVLLFLAMHWLQFDEMHLHFLCTGHSYSENDNCHGIVEKVAKK